MTFAYISKNTKIIFVLISPTYPKGYTSTLQLSDHETERSPLR